MDANDLHRVSVRISHIMFNLVEYKLFERGILPIKIEARLRSCSIILVGCLLLFLW